MTKKMAMCPLLKQECVREECVWYYVADSEEYSNCAVMVLSEQLGDVVDALGGMRDEMNSGFGQVKEGVDGVDSTLQGGITVYT